LWVGYPGEEGEMLSQMLFLANIIQVISVFQIRFLEYS
jgi:hypothetical protein